MRTNINTEISKKPITFSEMGEFIQLYNRLDKSQKEKFEQYYKTKKGRSTVGDEIIQELVKRLNGIEIRKKRKYYDFEPYILDIEPII